jgi:hypothetical protein
MNTTVRHGKRVMDDFSLPFPGYFLKFRSTAIFAANGAFAKGKKELPIFSAFPGGGEPANSRLCPTGKTPMNGYHCSILFASTLCKKT